MPFGSVPFILHYAVTLNDGAANNGVGWDDIALNNPAARQYLFGTGDGLISHVYIGGTSYAGVPNPNPYDGMRQVLKALGIKAEKNSNHNTHFHIDLRTPPIKRLDPPQNLLADNAVLDQTSSVVNDALRAAAQGLLSEIAPKIATTQGDLTMFVMDVPPDVPPQYAPIVVAEAKQAKQESKDRTIGVCHLVESRPESRESAVNSLGPVASAWRYLREREQVILKDADFYAAKTTLLQPPKYGVLDIDESTKSAGYTSNVPNYEGTDQATFLVEIGGYKVTVKYFFKVMTDVPGSGDEGSPEMDKRFCPNGPMWRISFDDSDPSAPIYTFTSPTQLTSALAGAVQANLTFADLSGDAVGQTVGNTITLDTNAAGHGWFVDSTPWDNAEFVATSNPNEWVALPGSEASGKMDLLTVFLHEYGHVLGLDHSADTHDFMSEELKPGVRHTVSVDDMQALWSLLGDKLPNDPSDPFNPLPLGSSLLFGFTSLRRPKALGQGLVLPPLNSGNSSGPGTGTDSFLATPTPTWSLSTQYERALHPDLYNGDFSTLDPSLAQYGWDSRGSTAIENGSLVLREDDRAFSGLTQGFVLPDGYVGLRFTLKGVHFAANGDTPPDAFEAALINMATGQSAVGTGALNHTDSLFNLQSNGVAYTSPAVTVTGLPVAGASLLDTDRPITVTVDLANVAAGSTLKLYLDLLGMGTKGSQVTIDDVKLLTTLVTNTAPVAGDDNGTTPEDQPLTINVLANDTDAENDPLTAAVITGAAHGTLVANANGSFTYMRIPVQAGT